MKKQIFVLVALVIGVLSCNPTKEEETVVAVDSTEAVNEVVVISTDTVVNDTTKK